ncbi:MAG: undecaprenyl/decaprenyl-phosphate alpha-N-acetylglucosaminyl 1-phosphate transferase, partial [Deltaproteobacteria bacterium]
VAIPYDGALSLPPFLASILTVFWLSGLTNAYNLLDGMDGLFSTVSGSAALFISFAGFLLGNTEAAIVAAILGASLFSLIPENSPPARIFPGDSASMTTGFLLGLLTLLCLRKPSGEVELFPALLFHGVALYDTAFVFTKRLLEKRSPFLPGLDHIHHRVLDLTGSVGKSLLTIISLHLLLSFLGFSLLFREATLPALAVTGLLATALLSWRKIRRLFLVAAGVRKKDSPGG